VKVPKPWCGQVSKTEAVGRCRKRPDALIRSFLTANYGGPDRIIEAARPTHAVCPCGSGGIRSPRSNRRYFSAVQSRCSPRLKIGVCSFGQERLPCAAEVGAGLVEGRRRATGAFAWAAARIEAAAPFPRRRVPWIAGAHLDRADLNVAVIDQPAFLLGFVIAAAGEGGHGSIKARPVALGKLSIPWDRNAARLQRIVDVENSAREWRAGRRYSDGLPPSFRNGPLIFSM
jgi:hypothetical protein